MGRDWCYPVLASVLKAPHTEYEIMAEKYVGLLDIGHTSRHCRAERVSWWTVVDITYNPPADGITGKTMISEGTLYFRLSRWRKAGI
jgi:hypothetical protein